MAVIYDDAQNKLTDLIYPGAGDITSAAILRDISKIVILTQAQYDALGVKDSNTIYITTP